MTDLPASLVLAGAGKMGGAMLQGWLAQGLAPGAITILEPRPSPELEAVVQARGIRLNPPLVSITAPELLVLAIKPQMLEEAGPMLAPLVGDTTLVVSILAGKTVAGLAGALGRASAPGAGGPHLFAVVRAMPNLPASIGRGATGAYASPGTSERQRHLADRLLGASGIVEWVEDEALIDAVTALSGSGPAYVFHLVECMAEAGIAAGLPAEIAHRLARATVAGAGELLAASPLSPARLRENVTSPGGTTAAALDVLVGGTDGVATGLAPLMRAAVAAAKRRAGELAG